MERGETPKPSRQTPKPRRFNSSSQLKRGSPQGQRQDFVSWTCPEVVEWVTLTLSRRFPNTEYRETCQRIEGHHIDGDILSTLEDSDWRELIPSIGFRKTLKQSYLALQQTLGPGLGGRCKRPSPVNIQRTELNTATFRYQQVDRADSPSQAGSELGSVAATPKSAAPSAAGTATESRPFALPLSAPGDTSSTTGLKRSPDGFCFMSRSSEYEIPDTSKSRTTSRVQKPSLSQRKNTKSSFSPLASISGRSHTYGYNYAETTETDRFTEMDGSVFTGRRDQATLDDAISLEMDTEEVRNAKRQYRGRLKSVAMFMSSHGELDMGFIPASSGATSGLKHLFTRSIFSNVQVIDYEYGYEQCWKRVVYQILRLGFFLKAISQLVTFTDVIFLALLCLWTEICMQVPFKCPYNPTILISATIFPLSFAVNAAYQRRELALTFFATLKASTFHMYLFHRSWQALDHMPPDFLTSTRRLIQAIFHKTRDYVESKNENIKVNNLKLIYQIFSELCLVIDTLRMVGLPAPLIAAAMNDLETSIAAFEKLRIYSDYRTPCSIRAFIRLSIYVVPLLLGPYFASLGLDHDRTWAFILVLFTQLLFLILKNVQRMLENPYGSYSTSQDDDIRLDALQATEMLEREETVVLDVLDPGHLVHSSVRIEEPRSAEEPGDERLRQDLEDIITHAGKRVAMDVLNHSPCQPSTPCHGVENVFPQEDLQQEPYIDSKESQSQFSIGFISPTNQHQNQSKFKGGGPYNLEQDLLNTETVQSTEVTPRASVT